MNLQAWRDEIDAILLVWACNPATHMEFMAALITAACAYVLLHYLTTRALHAPVSGFTRSAGSLALLVTVVLGAMIAAKFYVVPRLVQVPGAQWVPATCAVLAVAIIAVPFSARLTMSTYAEGLLAIVIAVAVAAGSILAVRTALDAYASRSADAYRARADTEEVNTFMKR